MTTYSRGMGQVQIALYHLQQELHEDGACLGLLPHCHNLRVRFKSAMSGQKDGDDGGLARLSGGWAGSELYSGGALVNGGRSLGHLFLVSRGDRERDL